MSFQSGWDSDQAMLRIRLRISLRIRLRARSPLVVIALLLAGSGWAQSADSPAPATLTSAQIVDRMQRENQVRANDLKHYQSLRHYGVEYKGLLTIKAEMTVEASYDAASGKSFRVVSQSGSKVLLDKVLKRAVDSELDAGKNQQANALTPANYRFRLEGIESLPSGAAYVLLVDPLIATKYLYRGRIWVDAVDFAVAKFEAEPAKNPSFWISRTDIHQLYAKTGKFWLPQQNRSESKIRVGGTALLTIDYGTYQVVP
jgi:hypothetical protein